MGYYKIILMVIAALLVFAFYLTLSVFTASRTMNSHLSFFKLFLISFFLTPLIGAALLINSQRKSYIKGYLYKCPECNCLFTEEQHNCPHCVKEGYNYSLKKVKRVLI